MSNPDRHNAVASWFLGPRGENFEYLERLFKVALNAQLQGRRDYFPADKPFITQEMQASSQFQDSIGQLERIVTEIAISLSMHHVPFWNPRYNGHMNMDTTLPGIAGYITTMIFNPNNVAIEASPLTTAIEIDVGKQLCEMIGIDKEKGWGHITCDGSIANLESIWAARNLKFYPLSLTLAMENDGPLSFIRDTFMLQTCAGPKKLFTDFTTWELLNITPDVVLDIPGQLYQQYLISPAFLQQAMNQYVIQTTPKDDPMFVKRFERDGISLNNIALIASATKHYSWPKGAAIAGIGSANLIDVHVDFNARMNIKYLRKQLDKCLAERRAIYAVVAIVGSTEQGACDPLKDIVEIRREYQSKGLSFVLHADGAWGAYYHTTLNSVDGAPSKTPSGFVPSVPLKPSTCDGLLHLRYCDSITVDPHKSGYIQYPAGGLLYRDARMRYLVTWTSPVVFRKDEESIGVYGVEGSKPGASPVAVWVSHTVIGLNQNGYGALLGEGVFGSVKMYAHLSTMSTPETDFRVSTLDMLPAEASGGDVEAQKEFIRKRILNVPNDKLVEDEEAMILVKKMGSDLSINNFAVNFRVNGEVNKDVVEANNLNMRIYERLSITSILVDMNTRPLILTSTQLAQSAYTECLDNFKERLGLVGNQDLYTLINVVISPFPTEGNFTAEIAGALQNVIEEEVKISQFRNTITPSFHGFVMQGTSSVYLVHLPMFNMADHRYQLIITGDLPADVLQKYITARKEHPKQFFTLGNAKPGILMDMIQLGKFEAVIDIGLPPSDGSHFISGFSITNIRTVHLSQLDSKYLTAYPKNTIPFYLYGNSREGEWHVDHALLASPNIQLNSDCITLEIGIMSMSTNAERPMVLYLHLPEAAMQPFPSNANIAQDPSFFFQAGAKFNVTVSPDWDSKEQMKGTLTLSETVFIDTDMLNLNPVPDHHMTTIDETPTDEENVKPVLRGSFDIYTGEETEDHPSIPLLSHVEPSMSELYLGAIKAAAAG